MMAGLFAFFVAAIVSTFFKKRKLAITFIVIGVTLSLIIFWIRAQDPLQINW